jgi:adenosylcobinamide-GDP ribazoletransferase
VLSGLALAVSVLTRLPVRPRRVDRVTAGAAMTWAPVVGAAIGGVGAGVFALVRWAIGDGATLLPAALAVVAVVAVTGALHLDGLADTADSLGVRGDHTAARAAAKDPAVGAFGVTAIAATLLVDVAAVATAGTRATTALVVGASAGRLAATWACHTAPAATADGLGAWVARTVSRRQAVAATVAVAVVAAVVGGLDASRHVVAGGVALGAAAVGLGVGLGVQRVGRARFGGLTGDALGAAISCGATAAYIVVAMTGSLFR